MERQKFIRACESANSHDYINLFQQNNFDINVCKEAFRVACQRGHLELAKWLLSVKPSINISADNDYAFRYACVYEHLETAQWLQTLCAEKYSLYVNDTGRIIYKIFTPLKINGTIQKTDLEMCPICQENQEELQTVDCKHGYCRVCIQTWVNKYANHNTCPMCRTTLENGFYKYIL